jgi:O-antigen/teichoic acid export membrane protein
MAGNIFTLAVGFPFQIYIARKLGPGDLGVFGLLDVGVQTLGALFGLGLGQVAVRYIPEYVERSQTGAIRDLLKRVYGIGLGMSVVALIVINLLVPVLVSWKPEIGSYQALIPIMSIMIPVSMLAGISQQVLRGFCDVRLIVIMSSFVQLVLKVVLTIVFFSMDMQLSGYICAAIVSAAFCLLGMGIGIWKRMRRLKADGSSSDAGMRSEWYQYGRVMYGNSLLGVAGPPLERFLLVGAMNISAVGVLVVIRQLQNLPQVFLQVIITVVSPMFVSSKSRDDTAMLYHLATDWICRLALPLLLFLLIRTSEILELYGDGFAEAGTVALIVIILAQCVSLFTGPVGNLLNMKGKHSKMLRINFVSVLVALVGCVVLVPVFGLMGVALVTVLSVSVTKFCAVAVARRELSIGWWSSRFYRWLMPAAVTAALFLLMQFTIEGASRWWMAGEFVAGFAVFHLVYFMGGICHEDRQVIAAIADRFSTRKSSVG